MSTKVVYMVEMQGSDKQWRATYAFATDESSIKSELSRLKKGNPGTKFQITQFRRVETKSK